MALRTWMCLVLGLTFLAAAAPTPIGYEVLDRYKGAPERAEGPPRLIVAQTQQQLVDMYADLSLGREVPRIDFHRRIVAGFDVPTGGCTPQVTQPTVNEQAITLPLRDRGPEGECPGEGIRPAYAVALDRQDLPTGTVTVSLLGTSGAELARTEVTLSAQQPAPDKLPATGLPLGWFAAATVAAAAAIALVAWSRRRSHHP